MAEDPAEGVTQRLARLEAQGAQLTEAVALLTRHATQRNWDAVAAVVASLIGVIAVAVAAYTAHLQRQQLRAQVWPTLRLEFSTVNAQFMLLNQGVGPARITGMRITIDGAPVHSFSGLHKAAGFPGPALVQSTLSATVVPAGKEIVYLQPHPGVPDAAAQFTKLLLSDPNRMVTTLCYCSVLDECWVVDSLGTPRPSQDCPIPEADRYSE